MEASVSHTAEVIPTTLAGLLREGISILSASGIRNAEHEAVWIMDFALGASRLSLRLEGQRQGTGDDRSRAIETLGRRAGREPLPFILGHQSIPRREHVRVPAPLRHRPA